MTQAKAGARPPLHMIDSEADTLSELAANARPDQAEVGAMLSAEIDRARIYPAARIPTDVVTMHTQVEFVDETTGGRRTVQLVYPADADIEAGRVSIMTPVGAGLIGLRAGGSILWPDRDGHQHTLTLVGVTQPDRG